MSSKPQIEEYGIAKFNEKCKDSVNGYLVNWNKMTERIGYWCDMKHPYVTMDNNYIETVWWTIKQLWDKGLVYQGYRVTPHCPRCGTSLSSHEVAQGYVDDTVDPSVYPKFKVVKTDNPVRGTIFGSKRRFICWPGLPLPGLCPAIPPWRLPTSADYAVVDMGD